MAASLAVQKSVVAALSGRLIGKLHVPLTIVPGSLTPAEIDAIT